MGSKHTPVSREDIYVDRVPTSITHETPLEGNPYIAKDTQWFGYPQSDILSKCTMAEAVCLFFYQELPSQDTITAFEKTFIALLNLGPRHESTRAAMTAAVSKTLIPHCLPIGLNMLSAESNGTLEVMRSYKFLEQAIKSSPSEAYNQCTHTPNRVAAGFGNLYGNQEIIPLNLAKQLTAYFKETRALSWAIDFSHLIEKKSFSLLIPGLVAAAALDLHLNARQAVGLFQLSASHGIFAHAHEISHRPPTSIPWIDDSNYEIKNDES